MPVVLSRSAHLSFFSRREAVFLYHDLWGYLLEMSVDVVSLIDAFQGGREVDSAVASVGIEASLALDYVSTLRQVAVLVEPEADELDALWSAYPVKSPWCAALEDSARQVDVVRGRSPTGPRHIERLEGPLADLWYAIDGDTSCRELAERFAQRPGPWREGHDAAAGLDAFVSFLTGWVHSDRQWLRMSAVPHAMQRTHSAPYLSSTMPYAPLGPDGPSDSFVDEHGTVSNQSYHEGLVAEAERQFEDSETTLSHLFRHPHPALGGRTWGGAFLDELMRRKLWPGHAGAVVEMGGGLGWFAKGLLERADVHGSLPERYVIGDITPALQQAQRHRISPWSFASCETIDAETLPLAAASVDLLISNEVVADLSTGWMVRTGDGWSPSLAQRAAERWSLPLHDAPDECALNLGTFKMVARLAEVLRPGGAAVLTEFGGPHLYPRESTQLDHPEFSIHFGHVAHVARACCLDAEIVSLPLFIGLEGDHLALRATRTWWVNVRHLLASRGVVVDKRAWTKAMFEAKLGLLSSALHGVHWYPISERVMGLAPDDFWAVILKKPPGNEVS